MKISTRVRYGLRLMFNLALHYGHGPQLLKEIAKKEDISEKYLSQIIIPLKSAGLVNAYRGAQGGYILAKNPSKINVKDIYEAIDGEINIVQCVKSNTCDRASNCVCRDVWLSLANNISRSLSEFSLHDLVTKSKELDKDLIVYNI